MFEGYTQEDLEGALEAMLFVSDGPVSAQRLAEILQCGKDEVTHAAHSLSERLSQDNRGIQLGEVAGGWQLFTHPKFHPLLESYILSWDTRKLTGAAMETLAIIAYMQPVTRALVSEVRGVGSDSTIGSLVEKGLVCEAGVLDAPGSPVLYATTKTFLEKFGLNSAKDLTPIEQFAPDESTRRLIADRLSATRENAALADEEASEIALEMAEADTLPEGALGDAIATVAGVVEKIDFDSLEFDFDDE